MTWQINTPDPEQAALLSRNAGASPLTARILLSRGLEDPDECKEFLSPRLDNLHSPYLLPDIDEATAAIASAVREKKDIVIHGDYDVDGVTGTALAANLLRMLGAEPSIRIPNRLSEGYGLNPDTARSIAEERPGLVLAVDCGTSDIEAIDILRSQGIDVVVMDHHEPGELPPAAVVNPKRADSEYPFRDLASVGIVFKVAWAVAENLSPEKKMSEEMRNFLLDSLGLVALGTIADVAPLTGENRVLAAYGLRALEGTKAVGTKALLRSAGYVDRRIRAHDVSFRLAPRINAAGRVKDAAVAVELFTTVSPTRADEIAEMLGQLNNERRKIQEDMVDQALEMAATRKESHAVVLADKNWHVGLVGIAASKVLDNTYLPSVMLVIEGDTARGSARSIPEFNIFEALEDCADLLEKYGGHALAAGLTVKKENIRPLAEKLSNLVREKLGDGMPERSLTIDTEVSLDELTVEAVSEVERLSPFGAGNRRPILAVRNGKVAGHPRRMGTKNRHVSFQFAKDGTSLRTVWWNAADRFEELKRCEGCDVAFAPKIENYRGTSVELDIKDVRFL